MAGLYFHIPFCLSRCYYCDFYSCTSLARKPMLLQTLEQEMILNRDFFGAQPLRTLYFGGGTPSLCTPEEIGRLIRRAASLWDTSQVEEMTLEANPDDLTEPYLAALRAEGVNRLSLGVQSFRDEDLRWMHRRHDAASARKAVHMARAAGFDNLTLDLIYGLPSMTLAQWDANLQEALDLGIEHLSAYHLTLEPGTVFGRQAARGQLRPADERAGREQFEWLHRRMTEAGFEHYEISNFARPGRRAVHNSSYWFGEPYLGVGPSAHSYDGKRLRRWNCADLRRYLTEMPHQPPYETETLSDTDLYNEYLMTRLRTDRGVDLQELSATFGPERAQYFLERADKFLAGGLMIRHQRHYRLPAEAFFVSDGIISDLFSD